MINPLDIIDLGKFLSINGKTIDENYPKRLRAEMGKKELMEITENSPPHFRRINLERKSESPAKQSKQKESIE